MCKADGKPWMVSQQLRSSEILFSSPIRGAQQWHVAGQCRTGRTESILRAGRAEVLGMERNGIMLVYLGGDFFVQKVQQI